MRKFFSVLYILSNLVDLSFTIHGVTLTGPLKEKNPIARAILLNHGTVGLSVFKLGWAAVAVILIATIAQMEWEDRWVSRYIPTLLLLLGSLVSLAGAWSWIDVF